MRQTQTAYAANIGFGASLVAAGLGHKQNNFNGPRPQVPTDRRPDAKPLNVTCNALETLILEGVILIRMEPSKNLPCPCGSGKKYKRCHLLLGGMNITPDGGYKFYNKRLNRYETNLDHHYASFRYIGFKYTNAKPYKGKVKCRLVHEAGNSIIIPDYIILKNGWLQPLHFIAPLLFKIDETNIGCDLFIDIQNGESVKVRFYNHSFIKSYSDGSQLFNCEIFGPADIEQYACGEYKLKGDDIYLQLFHHTNKAGYDGITGSKTLRSSKWNYRGSKECINYHFAYFTHIPEIKYSNDLITVAMSSDGNIDYMIDSFEPLPIMPPDYRKVFANSIYTAEVYRATTNDRNYKLSFFVPIESINIKHVYLHNHGNLFYYELCFPYIHRIKLQPNSTLKFDDAFYIENTPPVVNSDYCILGDARIKAGLAAPFEEEETEYVYKIEDCQGQTIQDFWFTHGNQDLYSSKAIKPLSVKDVKDNPTK